MPLGTTLYSDYNKNITQKDIKPFSRSTFHKNHINKKNKTRTVKLDQQIDKEDEEEKLDQQAYRAYEIIQNRVYTFN